MTEMIIDLFAGGGGASTDQGSLCGNSVPPPWAEALVRANCADMAVDAGKPERAA